MNVRRILFRCDAGALPEIGTGHLARCLLLAESLAERGCCCSLCGSFDESALRRIETAGVSAIERVDDELESELLERAVARVRPDVLVLDRLDTSLAYIGTVRDQVPVLITLDDRGEGAMLADIVVNAITGEGDAPYAGYDYLVVPPPDPLRPDPGRRPRVVMSFGGYDHGALGERVAEALGGSLDADISWLVRSGGDARASEAVEVVKDAPDFSVRMRSADVAVVNGGLTLFEALANGVPSVAIAQYPHQAQTIKRLVQRGAALGIESPGDDVGECVRTAVERLLAEPERREHLRRGGLETVDGLGLGRLVDLIRVVDRLDFDSEFFGFEVGRVFPQRLTERMLLFVLAEIERRGFECIYYLCDCHHAESVRLAESAGFHFVDIRLTFERRIGADDGTLDPEVRDAVEADVPMLRAIARDSYQHSRYWFDHRFTRADCERFYSDWVAKCVHAELADRVFVIDDGAGEPLGFVAVVHESAATAGIVLLGVSERARGRGGGQRLVAHALRWAQEEGYSRMQVVTQGRNYGAQRTYQRTGFITIKTELWYHLWRR